MTNTTSAVLNITCSLNVTLTQLGILGALNRPHLISLTSFAHDYSYSNTEEKKEHPIIRLHPSEPVIESDKITPAKLCEFLNMGLHPIVYKGLCFAFGSNEVYEEQIEAMVTFLDVMHTRGYITDEHFECILGTERANQCVSYRAFRTKFVDLDPIVVQPSRHGLALSSMVRKALFIEFSSRAIAKPTQCHEIRKQVKDILGVSLLELFDGVINIASSEMP